MMEKAGAILKAAETELLTITPSTLPPPGEARIRTSVRCARCGEKFMESRGRVRDGKIVCIPCAGQE
jgi:formylmethanofuran dehydrogenase subunit E